MISSSHSVCVVFVHCLCSPEIMVNHNLRHLAVVDGQGVITGLLNTGTVLRRALADVQEHAIGAIPTTPELQSAYTQLYHRLLTARDFISPPPSSSAVEACPSLPVVHLKDSVQAAARVMRDAQSTSVLVYSDDLELGRRLKGILTIQDIYDRVLSARMEPHLTSVNRVMSQNPDVVTGDRDLDWIVRLMNDGHFSHLPVIHTDPPTPEQIREARALCSERRPRRDSHTSRRPSRTETEPRLPLYVSVQDELKDERRIAQVFGIVDTFLLCTRIAQITTAPPTAAETEPQQREGQETEAEQQQQERRRDTERCSPKLSPEFRKNWSRLSLEPSTAGDREGETGEEGEGEGEGFTVDFAELVTGRRPGPGSRRSLEFDPEPVSGSQDVTSDDAALQDGQMTGAQSSERDSEREAALQKRRESIERSRRSSITFEGFLFRLMVLRPHSRRTALTPEHSRPVLRSSDRSFNRLMLDIGCALLGNYGNIDQFSLSYTAPVQGEEEEEEQGRGGRSGLVQEFQITCDDDLKQAVTLARRLGWRLLELQVTPEDPELDDEEEDFPLNPEELQVRTLTSEDNDQTPRSLIRHLRRTESGSRLYSSEQEGQQQQQQRQRERQRSATEGQRSKTEKEEEEEEREEEAIVNSSLSALPVGHSDSGLETEDEEEEAEDAEGDQALEKTSAALARLQSKLSLVKGLSAAFTPEPPRSRSPDTPPHQTTTTDECAVRQSVKHRASVITAIYQESVRRSRSSFLGELEQRTTPRKPPRWMAAVENVHKGPVPEQIASVVAAIRSLKRDTPEEMGMEIWETPEGPLTDAGGKDDEEEMVTSSATEVDGSSVSQRLLEALRKIKSSNSKAYPSEEPAAAAAEEEREEGADADRVEGIPADPRTPVSEMEIEIPSPSAEEGKREEMMESPAVVLEEEAAAAETENIPQQPRFAFTTEFLTQSVRDKVSRAKDWSREFLQNREAVAATAGATATAAISIALMYWLRRRPTTE